MNLQNLTLEDIKTLQKQKLQELIECAGTLKHLAFMLDIPLPTLYGWVERGRVSKEAATKIEQHETLGQKFKAEELRPDILINK